MSIDLIGVSHSMKQRRSKRRMEFRDINMHIEERQRVALLGKKGSGLEEIMNIICGAVYPARGHVMLSSEISWPIGEAGFLSPDSSLAMNLRFVARIYEMDANEYAERVGEVAEIQEHWNETLGACSKDVKSRFGFALGVCLPFNIYLFEAVEPADKNYREKAQTIVEQLGRDRGIVVATSKGEVAQQYCDRGFVLDGGKTTYYEDIDSAVAHLERLEEPALGEFEETEVVDETQEDDAFDVI